MIRLEPLTAEEMLVLCEKLAEMHAGLYGYSRHITTEDLVSFIKIEYGRIGADQNITPREVIRDFIELLDLLYQHPDMDITELLGIRRIQLCQIGSCLRMRRIRALWSLRYECI